MVILLAAASTALAVAFSTMAIIERFRNREPTVPHQEPWQSQAGVDVTPIQFWLASIGTGALTYLLVYAVTSLPLISAMPAIVVATLPRAYFGRKRARRLAEVQEAWPDGLRDLIASVRSGASLPTAIENLAGFGPAPLRSAFQGFTVYSRSLGVVPALEMIKSDLADPTSDRVIEVLILAYERGGAVVPDILSDLAEATTRDIWTLEQIRTEALEQKINARVVFVLPWFVLIAMTAQAGAFREFYSTPAGLTVAFIGGVMSLLGIVIASRLGNQPAEPRVFTSGRAL
ncbi:MAG TPA: type II secretion system F family protein [Acidimicrobiia bacterium]|nr:type II secretion system F family protein [Acidimicrobiia bacterium]